MEVICFFTGWKPQERISFALLVSIKHLELLIMRITNAGFPEICKINIGYENWITDTRKV